MIISDENTLTIDLREYLVKNLVYCTHSKLLSDENFIKYTKIKTPSNLAKIIKKLNITMEEVFIYGIDNGYIRYGISFLEWLEFSGRKCISTKYKKNGYDYSTDVYNSEVVKTSTEKTIEDLAIRQLLKKRGLTFDDSDDIEMLNMILSDLVGDTKKLISEISNQKKKIIRDIKKKQL